MTRLRPLLLAASLPLLGCGDDGPPLPIASETTGSEDSDTTMTATADAATAVDPATTSMDATTSAPTATGETTTGDTEPTSTGMEPTTTSETEATAMGTESTTTGDAETTTSDTETGGGTSGFANCFPDESTCLPTETCLLFNVPSEASHGTVCSLPGCNDADDCPEPPAGGNPTVICEDLFVGDGLADCLLSCADGEACPPGYHCTIYGVCVGDTEWTCDFDYYTDALCDCGCGMTDVFDCPDTTVDSCDYCDDVGSCTFHACPGAIDPEDNAVCDPLVLWTCDVAAYDDGATCDCGCGSVDPDCANPTEEACEACNGVGSCAADGVGCDTIQDLYNAICEAPPEWICDPDWYADGTCNCGCGAFDDFDCVDESVDACDACGSWGACDEGTYDCSLIDADTNWLCA